MRYFFYVSLSKLLILHIFTWYALSYAVRIACPRKNPALFIVGVVHQYPNRVFWSDMQGKHLSQMLDEDPALMERRVQLSKRLELFKHARDEIDAVIWAK